MGVHNKWDSMEITKWSESCREWSFYVMSLTLSGLILMRESWIYNPDDMWKFDRQYTVPKDFKALYLFECSWCVPPAPINARQLYHYK